MTLRGLHNDERAAALQRSAPRLQMREGSSPLILPRGRSACLPPQVGRHSHSFAGFGVQHPDRGPERLSRGALESADAANVRLFKASVHQCNRAVECGDRLTFHVPRSVSASRLKASH